MKIVLANVSKFPVGWYNLDFKWHINVTLINNELTSIFYNLAENIFTASLMVKIRPVASLIKLKICQSYHTAFIIYIEPIDSSQLKNHAQR